MRLLAVVAGAAHARNFFVRGPLPPSTMISSQGMSASYAAYPRPAVYGLPQPVDPQEPQRFAGTLPSGSDAAVVAVALVMLAGRQVATVSDRPKGPKPLLLAAPHVHRARARPLVARLARVSQLDRLDPETDRAEITNRAASSLRVAMTGGCPGTWGDVALCTLRNLLIVGAILAAVGALPGQASATTSTALAAADSSALLSIPESTSLLVVDGDFFENLDVIAIIAVPLLVGGALVAFAAANYEKFIDKINGGR